MNVIAPETLGGLRKFRATDREECGLIVHNDGVFYVLKVPNRSDNPNDYAIWLEDVENVEAVLSDGEEVVGYLHTHLGRHQLEPSDEDITSAMLNREMLHVIYKPTTRELHWYGAG